MLPKLHKGPNLSLPVKSLYESMQTLTPGIVATFDQMTVWAGIDVRLNRAVIASAVKKLFAEDGKLFVNLRGIGYRYSLPGEYCSKAKGHRMRAVKALKKESDILNAVNLEALTKEERVQAVQERGKSKLLEIACAIASRPELSHGVNYRQLPSEDAVIKFLSIQTSTKKEM